MKTYQYQHQLEKLLIDQYQHFHDEIPKDHLEKSFFDEIIGMKVLLYHPFKDHIKMNEIVRMSQIKIENVYWVSDEKGRKIPFYENKPIKALLLDIPMEIDDIQHWIS